MSNTPDIFTSTLIAQAVGGRPFRYFAQVSSTNNVAQKWAQEGAPAGAVVIANEQTNGRGRLGRLWETPPGQAIAMSIVLRPEIDPRYVQRLTILGALAVAEVLANYVEAGVLRLKWPNDVMLSGRKVCGVLAEAFWQGNELQAVILGIGINVRVDFANTSLAEIATSLEDHAIKPVSRLLLIHQVLQRVDAWLEKLHDDALVSTWKTWLDTLGQRVHIQLPGGLVEGTAHDVDNAGALLIIDDAGRQHLIMTGDIYPE